MNSTLKQMAIDIRASLNHYKMGIYDEGNNNFGIGRLFGEINRCYKVMIGLKADELQAPYADIERVFWSRYRKHKCGHSDLENAIAYVSAMEDIAQMEFRAKTLSVALAL